MYIEEWDAFYQQAEAMFLADPLKTRLVLKYAHSKAKLTLKVTDDRTVSSGLAADCLTRALRALTCLDRASSTTFCSAAGRPIPHRPDR